MPDCYLPCRMFMVLFFKKQLYWKASAGSEAPVVISSHMIAPDSPPSTQHWPLELTWKFWHWGRGRIQGDLGEPHGDLGLYFLSLVKLEWPPYSPYRLSLTRIGWDDKFPCMLIQVKHAKHIVTNFKIHDPAMDLSVNHSVWAEQLFYNIYKVKELVQKNLIFCGEYILFQNCISQLQGLNCASGGGMGSQGPGWNREKGPLDLGF